MVPSMFIQGCYNIVDSIFVAYVSQAAFIALPLVFPIQTVLVSVNVGIGVGINALLSRRLGEGGPESPSPWAERSALGRIFCDGSAQKALRGCMRNASFQL